MNFIGFGQLPEIEKNFSRKPYKITLSIQKKGNEIMVRIKDSGKGISKNELDKIFDRFYQIKSANSSKIIGSGIGLAFSKKIIELHLLE